MAATDLVPCFYTGQNYRVEKPAEVRTRAEVREFKAQKLGKFIENGRLFLFFKIMAQKAKQLWDGPFGVGNLLPFYKSQNPLMAPQKLHYEIPKANDLGIRRHGLYRQGSTVWLEGDARKKSLLLRHRIRVSARKIDFTAAAYLTPTRTLSSPNPSSSSLMQLA